MSDGEGKSSKDVKIAAITAAATVLAALITALGAHYWPDKAAKSESNVPQARSQPAQPSNAASGPASNPRDDRKIDFPLAQATTTQPAAATRVVEAPPLSLAQQISGEYILQSYFVNGQPMPLQGAMSLRNLSDTDLQFESSMSRTDVPGAIFRYRGTLRAAGAVWYVAVTATNDPTVLIGQAVANTLSYQSGVLGFQSEYGHVVTWRKQ